MRVTVLPIERFWSAIAWSLLGAALRWLLLTVCPQKLIIVMSKCIFDRLHLVLYPEGTKNFEPILDGFQQLSLVPLALWLSAHHQCKHMHVVDL